MNPRPVLPMTETTQQDPVTGTAASRESHGGQPDVQPIPTGDDGHSVRSVHPLFDASVQQLGGGPSHISPTYNEMALTRAGDAAAG